MCVDEAQNVADTCENVQVPSPLCPEPGAEPVYRRQAQETEETQGLSIDDPPQSLGFQELFAGEGGLTAAVHRAGLLAYPAADLPDPNGGPGIVMDLLKD